MEIVICIATVVIAIYAALSYRTASAINRRDSEHKEQVEELFKAFVIMMAVSSAQSRSPDVIVDDFRNRYARADGKVEIFPLRRKS